MDVTERSEMTKKPQQLKVYYDSKVINPHLDDAIENAVKPFGYKRWASGYDLVGHKRDLAFDKGKV